MGDGKAGEGKVLEGSSSLHIGMQLILCSIEHYSDVIKESAYPWVRFSGNQGFRWSDLLRVNRDNAFGNSHQASSSSLHT
jgi:hypothetical protein